VHDGALPLSLATKRKWMIPEAEIEARRLNSRGPFGRGRLSVNSSSRITVQGPFGKGGNLLIGPARIPTLKPLSELRALSC
jgi:hypothetical protein